MRGGWVVPFSSGSGVRVPQRQRKRHQPRRAAPFGASCDESPRIRPYKVVAPKGAARRRLGSAFALQQRLYFPLSAPRGLCEKSPNLGAEMPLPLGAAALALGVAFPQRRLRGLPPPRPIWLCLARPSCSSLKLPSLVPSGAGRGLRWLLVRVPLLRTICGRSARRAQVSPRAAYARRLAATSRRCRSCARPSVCAASLRIAALRLIFGAFPATAILA